MGRLIQYIKYLLRWQLSGVVLAPVLAIMTDAPLFDISVITATAVSNLIGGAVFYFVDKRIFKEVK